MTGIVKGWVEVRRDDTYRVLGDSCAAADEHRTDRPVCYITYPDGEFRACPYWACTTSPSNYTDRQHPSTLNLRAKALGANSINCQIVCHASRRNRPPGC